MAMATENKLTGVKCCVLELVFVYTFAWFETKWDFVIYFIEMANLKITEKIMYRREDDYYCKYYHSYLSSSVLLEVNSALS